MALIEAPCSCYSFIAHAFVLTMPLLCAHLFLLRPYCTFVFATPLLRMQLFLLCFNCACNCSCFASIVHIFIFRMLLFISWPSWAAFQLLIFLHCYIKLFLIFWPSCIATMYYFSVHDPFALLHYVVFQFLTLLHCYVVIFLSSLTLLRFCVALEFLTLLCYSLVHDLFMLLCCATP